MPRAPSMVITGRKTAPGGGETAYKSYAVVSDAGVQGSKMHILLPGCLSIILFQATAGLRALGTATSEQILQAVEIPGCSLLMLLLVQEGVLI
ncbi:hypothetical protein BHE74_00003183 [Ensete ventricosum]|nr:hypothetical protein BHE74_00003183 [Ensete ventricosum]